VFFLRDVDAMADMIELNAGLDAINRAFGVFGNDPDMTAWRVEFICREFKTPPPIEVWFSWPLHRIDTSGALKGCGAKVPGSLRKAEVDIILNDACERLIEGRDEFPMRELSDDMSVTDKTTKNRLEQSSSFEYVPGVNKNQPAMVRRKPTQEHLEISE